MYQSVCDGLGHQELECTSALLREWYYWHSMANDVSSWIKRCKQCIEAKAHYLGIHPKQGSIVISNPMELLCVDFTLMEPSRMGKENVLIMTDDFSNVVQAVITSNQAAKTVARVLVEKCLFFFFFFFDIQSSLLASW